MAKGLDWQRAMLLLDGKFGLIARHLSSGEPLPDDITDLLNTVPVRTIEFSQPTFATLDDGREINGTLKFCQGRVTWQPNTESQRGR